MSNCNDRGGKGETWCAGYVMGVVSGVLAATSALGHTPQDFRKLVGCVPPESQKMLDAVRDYLARHREELGVSGSALIRRALVQAYPPGNC
jgi:hypothetical protein